MRNLNRLENCDICASFDMNTCIVKCLACVGQLIGRTIVETVF